MFSSLLATIRVDADLDNFSLANLICPRSECFAGCSYRERERHFALLGLPPKQDEWSKAIQRCMSKSTMDAAQRQGIPQPCSIQLTHVGSAHNTQCITHATLISAPNSNNL